MTQSNLPISFLRANAKDQSHDQSRVLCVLERVENVVTQDDEHRTEKFPLLAFKRNNLRGHDLVRELQHSIVSDIQGLKFEYDRDGDRLNNQSQRQAEFNGPVVSPFFHEDVKDIDIIYRLTMDDGQNADLFQMRNTPAISYSEQIEMQICKALNIDPLKPQATQVPALFKPPQSPDAAL